MFSEQSKLRILNIHLTPYSPLLAEKLAHSFIPFIDSDMHYIALNPHLHPTGPSRKLDEAFKKFQYSKKDLDLTVMVC
jgi:hypothetical protein